MHKMHLLHLDMPRPMGGPFFSEEKGRRNREGEGEGKWGEKNWEERREKKVQSECKIN